MCRWVLCKASKLPYSTTAAHRYRGKQPFSSNALMVDDSDGLVEFNCNDTPTTFASLLRSLGLAGALADGRQVHSSIVHKGLEGNSFLGNLLVQLYARCLDLQSARLCFHQIQDRNVFSWNFLIGAYDGVGKHKEVLHCFHQMQAESVIPDNVTFVHVLSAYASNQAGFIHGKWVHACVLSKRLHLILSTALFNLYGRGSQWKLAWSTFLSMPEQDLASWNAFISVCALEGQHKEAFRIYQQLHQESFLHDDITLVNVLTAFACPMALALGKQVHASINHGELEKKVFLGTALANMYGKCCCLSSAQSLFDQMSVRNVVTWNAMISMYAEHGQGQEAMQLYQQMQQQGLALNDATFVSLLDACARERLLAAGRILHACLTKYGYDGDASVGTALVNMYNKCLSVQEGQAAFNLLPLRNVVAFNAMMTGFVHLGQGKEALDIFHQMQQEKMPSDDITVSIVLRACALESALTRGKSTHSVILQSGFDLDIVVKNSILNMYGKCGCVNTAQHMFHRMPQRNVVSWNCIMASHAQHGNWFEVFELLFEMECHEIVPDKTSFTSILSACSHAGLVHVGIHFLFTVLSEYNTLPSIDLFDCMIDMAGRAAQLDEAENIISKMPMQPRNISWTTVLSACKCAADAKRGFFAAKSRVEIVIDDPLAFLTLSNIYAASGMKESNVKLMDCLLIEDFKLLETYPLETEV